MDQTEFKPFRRAYPFRLKERQAMAHVYRLQALNKITVKNRYPLPKVEELMDRLHGARYFTKLDLYSGYHQIRLREEDIQKTAFVTRYGAFKYLVMPFGLCNVPATFQRVMNTILRDGLDRFVLVFLDDILIFNRTREEHEQHIRALLDRLRSEKFFCRVKNVSSIRRRSSIWDLMWEPMV